MAKMFNVTVNELSKNHGKCPNCGRDYTPVKYYTGKLISVTNSRVNLSTTQMNRTYSSLGEHTGGICLPCAAVKEKKKMPRMIVTTIIGLILTIIGIIMEVDRITNRTTATTGLGIILCAVGGLMFLCGTIAMIVIMIGITNKNATRNSQSLFNYYVDQLSKDGKKWYDLEYLYPGLVKKK